MSTETTVVARTGRTAPRGLKRAAHSSPRGLKPAALVATGFLLLGLTACGPTSFVITPVPAEQELREQVVLREGAWATKKIALVDVDGILRNTRERSMLTGSGENPVSLFAEKLDQAAKDDSVRAVVLRINSPGGTVTATDLMYAEVRSFRQRTGKPVVACMLDVAASGGYYLACAADRIYAHPTTVTGSIGVIMVAPEFAGTMQKLGVRANVFKSGPLKDAGSMFRELNDADRAVFQGLIDGMYAGFLEVVAAARPGIEAERLKQLADGRVYLGAEAVKLGLVDETGTLHDAIFAAKELAGLSDKAVKVVEYARPLGYRPNVYAQTDGSPAQVNLINVGLPEWLSSPSPQLMYLWAPGW
jgi:protease-4